MLRRPSDEKLNGRRLLVAEDCAIIESEVRRTIYHLCLCRGIGARGGEGGGGGNSGVFSRERGVGAEIRRYTGHVTCSEVRALV